MELLCQIGELIPQYHGTLTHEVTYRPGNEGCSYSQSANTILAHTEAPGWDPSPPTLPCSATGSPVAAAATPTWPLFPVLTVDRPHRWLVLKTMAEQRDFVLGKEPLLVSVWNWHQRGVPLR